MPQNQKETQSNKTQGLQHAEQRRRLDDTQKVQNDDFMRDRTADLVRIVFTGILYRMLRTRDNQLHHETCFILLVEVLKFYCCIYGLYDIAAILGSGS